MTAFRGKLRRAFRVEEAAESGLTESLRRREEWRRRRLPVVELPVGSDLVGDDGTCYLRRLEYPLDAMHGAFALGASRDTDWQRIAALAKQEGLAAPLEECVFLDTETTGLAGGAGTVVFLCGMGFFEPGCFVVEQVFLRAFNEERAALAHVAVRLRERPWLVTYVGKSYDRHRIAARMAVHKLDSPVLTDQHLDLYYLARRAWGKDLPNVKLRTVEERILGLEREGDMPGAEAPYAFLTWIRDRTGRVDRVFEHNRLDVLSLVTLLWALGGGVDHVESVTPEPPQSRSGGAGASRPSAATCGPRRSGGRRPRGQ